MINNSILIGAENSSPRLSYTLELTFKQLMSIDYKLTYSSDEFYTYSGPKIYYAKQNIEGDHLFMEADDLLYDTKIIKIDDFSIAENIPFLFSKRQTIRADIFAAIFYLVTRMEEYELTELDEHGRFQAKHSILSKMESMEIPVVHLWTNYLRTKLKEKFKGLTFTEKRKFSFLPSYDIDMAWSYKNKGYLRSGLGFVKDVLTQQSISDRMDVLRNKIPDPFDTFQFFDEHDKNLNPIYFFLLADHGKFDKNIKHTNPSFISLIKALAERHNIGIHPSYASNKLLQKVKDEKSRLESICQKEIENSRQHYLKIKFPDTYRNLIRANLKHDYSMGYPDKIGFRAGICIPYRWYDLKSNQVTELTIHPFQVMDVTLKNYLNLNPEKALQECLTIMDHVHKYDGEFVFIWHNSSIQGEWKVWNKVYQGIIHHGNKLLGN